MGRHSFLGLAALLSCLVLAGVSKAQPEPPLGEVTWAAVDFPPFQIVEGPHLGTGAFDGLRNLLIREIPDARHGILTQTFAQREEALREGQLLCSPGVFRTPARERYLVFSKPALIHLDNRLVYLNRNAGRFPVGAAVKLEAVFMDRRLTGGIIAGRSFAPNIDALIRRYGGAANIRVLPAKPARVLEMLEKGEIDYTIMFSHEADFLERQAGNQRTLANRRIDGTPPFILTHVACTRCDWGERVIARVNRILQAHRSDSEYRQLSERWYSAPDRELIRKYYPQLTEAEGEPPR
jgi:uncharacterized protein (TIGR02285 family)